MNNLKILLIGNGFNMAFLEKGGEYSCLLEEASNYAKNLAIKNNLFVSLDRPKLLSIIDDPVLINLNSIFDNSQIANKASKDQIRVVNYYNKYRIWDSETILSLYFISRSFQKLPNKLFEINKIKSDVREIIIKSIGKIGTPVFIDKEKMISKLNSYDLILTTNYDDNLETLNLKGKIIHLHGDISKDLKDIKMGPFGDKEKILKLVENIDFKSSFLDIFGLSLITEPHILKFIFKNNFKEIRHYIYEIDINEKRENMRGLLSAYTGDEIFLQNTIAMGFSNSLTDDLKKHIKKINSFNKVYEVFPSIEFLESSNIDGVNETMVLGIKDLWD